MDGCGGFLLLPGERWTVGGVDQDSPADVCVRADWPRRAGVIEREGADYFWRASLQQSSGQQPSGANEVEHKPRELMTSGRTLPITGSAEMKLVCPSSLSTSATLSLKAPHRFDGHVNSVILVNDTFLIGRSSDCHIRLSADLDSTPNRTVVVFRSGRWQAKADDETYFHELFPGVRTSLQSLAITLEQA